MRAFAFFALLALTASAFNLTDYHLGIDSVLGFNNTEVQQGLTCLNALTTNFQNIADLIETRDFDSISLGLGAMVIQVQTDLETTCKPYFVDYYVYLAENTNITNLNETIKESIEQNYPFIIQTLGEWARSLSQGEDFNAGIYQSIFLQQLVGMDNYVTDGAAESQVTTPVPFNRTAFFTEYNAALFQVLGIDAQVNVSGLVECSYYVQNATLTFLYIKEKLSTLDFEQKLDGLQYFIGLTFDSIRNCDAAGDVIEAVFGPIKEAFSEDPVNFTLEALENFAVAFPAIQTSIQAEKSDIEAGEYYLAGQEKAGRLYDIFGSLVNFTSAN